MENRLTEFRKNAFDNINKKTIIIAVFNVCLIAVMLYCVFGFNTLNPHFHWYTNFFYLCLYTLILEIVYCALRKALVEVKSWSNIQLLIAVIIVLVCAFQMLFISNFIHSERDIKTYDSTVYWIKDIQVSEQMYGNIRETLKTVFNTIETQEYNNLASVFAVPIIFYWGNSFLKFICSNYLFFYLPFCLSLALYVMRLTKKESEKGNVFILSFLISTFSVILFWPLINGFLDSIGLFIISLLLHVTYDWDYQQVDIKKIIFLSGLSLLLLFSRRWYAFFIVGFYSAFGVEFVIEQINRKKISMEQLKNFIINMVMIAGLSSLIILIFFPGLFGLFFKNYGDAYSYYKSRTAFEEIWYYIKELGIINTLLCFVGLVLGIRDELHKKGRKLILFLMVCSIVTFVLYENVQNMAEHQRYLMLPMLLISESYLVVKVCERKKSILINAIILAVCFINFLVAFAQFDINDKQYLFTQMRRYPIVRNDFDEINQIVDVLMTETEDSNKKIYIAVDSSLFSQELLKRAKLPDVIDAMPNIINACIVDKRDGFPSQCFLADYIITAPTLYNSQKVVSEITRLLQENDLFKEYYTMIDEVYIAEDIPICIYRKNKPLDVNVVKIFSNSLKEYYDDDFVTEANNFVSLINVISANAFEYYSWDDSIQLYKREGQEIIFEYQLDKMNRIGFDLYNWYTDIRMQIYMDDQLQYDEVLPCDGGHQYEFDVSNKSKITIKIIGDSYADVYLIDGFLE